MSEVVASYQVSAFTVPANATAGDADQVRGNDNTIRAALNSHDADSGVHFQGSVLASRPVAGTAGRKWLTTDDGRLWYDDGSNWQEVGVASIALLALKANIASPTFTGVPAAPTAAGGTNSTQLATTAFVTSSFATTATVNAALALKAPLAGPTFTGNLNGFNVVLTGSLTMNGGLTGLYGGQLQMGGDTILVGRRTGWGSPTGTATRTTFDTATVTLPLLAQRVKALIDDLMTHGLIGV